MPVVDIKLGTALVNTFDGSPTHLNAFLDAVALFSDTVDAEFVEASAEQKAAARLTVARFIKTRITGTARQAVGELNSLQEIVDAIKTRCTPKISSDAIWAKLKLVKQNATAENFCDAVEKLTNDLKSAYITEGIPHDTADKMSTKRGVETLINGAKNSDVKIILKAGNFAKLNDAVQKLQENEPASEPQSHMFYVRGNNQYRGRGRGYTNNNNRGNRSRGRFNYNGGRYQNPGSYNYNNYHNPGQYNSNNYRIGNNWRGGNNNYHNQRNQGPGRQIFYANQNQGNVQIPQQPPQPRQLQQQSGGIVMNNQQNQQVQLANIVQQHQ